VQGRAGQERGEEGGGHGGEDKDWEQQRMAHRFSRKTGLFHAFFTVYALEKGKEGRQGQEQDSTLASPSPWLLMGSAQGQQEKAYLSVLPSVSFSVLSVMSACVWDSC
jgi:hypothetical protein